MSTGELSSDASRVQHEQTWHDQRQGEAERSAVLSRLTGPMTLDALRVVYATARDRCPGALALDYGSADGEAALILRRYGASAVLGIDGSPAAVQQATDRVAAEGVSDVAFQVMNRGRLALPDAQFDLVFGVGILQRLDLPRAFGEVSRVLKTHGAAVFLEPLAHNPFINIARLLTPHARTRDAQPLTMADVRQARHHFNRVGTRFVNLTALLGAPLAGLPGALLLHRTLSAVDRQLLRLPWLSRFAWNVVLTLEKPKMR